MRKSLFVAMLLLTSALFFGAEYLYKFTWKRRRLKVGTPKEREQYSEDLKKFRNDMIGYHLFLSAIIGSALFGISQHQIMAWSVNLFGTRATQLTTGSAVLVIGLLASWYRLKARVNYGLIEIAFGAIAAYVAAGHIVSADNVFPAMMTLGGCVYVVARGCSNVLEGWGL
jgi:hypothetical protein